MGCKLESSRQWAVRIMHEKKSHSDACFLTLTYDPANLPPGNTLVLRDLTLFHKRAYKALGPIRYFSCGEYGEKNGRPHYHVLLLNKDFVDKKPVSSRSENPYFASKLLSVLWPHGQHIIGNVDFNSAAYVARYCTKKITGDKAADHYQGRTPEFLVMSRRPGIGASYFDKFQNEMFTHDNIIINGLPAPIPRFYNNKYAKLSDTCEARLAVLKLARRRKISRVDKGTTRLRIKEVVTLAKLAIKGRKL